MDHDFGWLRHSFSLISDEPRGTVRPEVYTDSNDDVPVLSQNVDDIGGSDEPAWNPCRGRNDGTYADDDDCTRYYHCSNGYPYRMTCSAGTVWNDQLKGCSFTYHTGAIYQYYHADIKMTLHERHAVPSQGNSNASQQKLAVHFDRGFHDWPAFSR